jgi:hypothetical protein
MRTEGIDGFILRMQSELHEDVYSLTIAAGRSPQRTIPAVAVGSMGTGTGNDSTTCLITETDPQLTVDAA